MRRINHWIGGQTVEGTSGRTGPVWNPATGEQQAEVDFASAEEVDRAVATAKDALIGWRSASLSRRSEVMFHLRELVDEMLASIRTAANRDLWTPDERQHYESELALIMNRVRAEAMNRERGQGS